jgi:hypothetical protein
MTAITPPSAPFSSAGNLLGYVKYENDAEEWRPNHPFSATLRIHDIKRSVSSARFIWRDEHDGTLYPMLLPDMIDILTSGTISLGVTKGWWIVGQRGKNYGLRRAFDSEVAAQPTPEEIGGDMACSMPRPHVPHDLTHEARTYHCDGVRVFMTRRPAPGQGEQTA